ncbi:hypothetical protein [Actinoplanes subtropicus]|uniref:hypothetical protein n=1 Tax=Actinoplanes subtropicus TaxID=543632 RepID=UPI0004C3C608|nr:hypothetical protein [Actinoplanes subtropicus]
MVVDRYLAEQQLIQPGDIEASSASSRRLGRTLNDIRTDYHHTRAWTLPGGSAAWDTIAQAHAPAWFDHVKHLIDHEH